jgi:RNA polymerase sigma factor (sigma-70 family)
MPWTTDPYYDGDPEKAARLHWQKVNLPNDPEPSGSRGRNAQSLLKDIPATPATEMEALMQAAPNTEPVTSAEELLERFENGKLDSLVQDCVDRLPAQERQAFILQREGLTERAIATELGVSQPTAHRLIKRAQNTLQNEISVHPVYVERHLKAETPDRNATRPADNWWVNDCRKIQRLLNLGTANARWRIARILFDLRYCSAPMGKVAEVTYLSPLTIDSLADEFANG